MNHLPKNCPRCLMPALRHEAGLIIADVIPVRLEYSEKAPKNAPLFLISGDMSPTDDIAFETSDGTNWELWHAVERAAYTFMAHHGGENVVAEFDYKENVFKSIS